MHHIQRTILHQLMQYPSRRYGQLKPRSIEGNVFTYHLRQLTTLGYIMRSEAGDYRLTSAGKIYVDRLSLTNLLPRIQPKIITLIACRNEVGEWLVLRRKRQPLLGQVGFVYGKIHQGELVAEAAKRELQEKSGLQAELKHRGDGYINIAEQGEPISQVMFHMFEGTNAAGSIRQTPSGEVFWVKEQELSRLDCMASMTALIELLKSGQERFFVELSYDA